MRRTRQTAHGRKKEKTAKAAVEDERRNELGKRKQGRQCGTVRVRDK